MKFYFMAEGLFDIKDILRIKDTVKNSFVKYGDFIEFSPKGRQGGDISVKGTPPILPELKGITFTEFFIIGYLPIKQNSFDELFKILKKGEDDIGNTSDLSIEIDFQIKTSVQNKKYSDTIGVGIKKGEKYFEYSSNTSNVLDRKRFFENLFKIANLPLELIEKENDYYITHKMNGELFTSATGIKGENPQFFRCEISEEAYRDIKNCINSIFQNYATDKLHKYKWIINIMATDSENTKRVYDLIIEKNFSAQKCDINFSFTLNNIEGIESLRQLCGPKGEFSTLLCSFDLPDNNWGEIHIITRYEGHKLELTMWRPDHLKLVEEALGLEFKQITD